MQIKARVDLAEGVDKVRAAGKSRWRGGDQSGVIDGRGVGSSGGERCREG